MFWTIFLSVTSGMIVANVLQALAIAFYKTYREGRAAKKLLDHIQNNKE